MGLWFGMIAFSLFFLSDYNDWRMGRKALRLCFPLGGLLLAAGTLLRCGEGEILVSGGAGKAVLFGAAAFLALLIYTLFFAIPAEASYAKPGQKRRVCTTGVYALCRHPGVLWFVGLYACLSAAAGLPAVDSVVYSAANVLLIRFEEKLKKQKRDQLWSEYCGFLDMSLTEYMYVQRRLMEEQLELWRNSGLGKSLLKGQVPYTIDELRRMLPLTSYEDYADVLLSRRTEMLCAEPAIWIQTTWEGGLRPIKLAPYTRSMLDTYRHNLLAAMMMASARKKGDFDVKSGDRILYGGAPLPYMTGLMPSLFAEDIHFEFLPDSNKNSELSFSQRIKKGFSMALSGGVDVFFGIGSVANYITESFGKSGGGGGKTRVSPGNALRYARAKYISKRDGRAVVPGDIFRLKAFFYAGTDAKCYKERLTRAWGVVPTELAAGTESTCLGSEDWEHRGMVFFPDACFYEFIPEMEMRRNLRDPAYQPRTCLMDEVQAGEVYEIVLSVFHGGAFMRYRIGDMYRCLSAGGGQLPRMTFVDRVPNVIDIAGFTRITASSMEEVIRLSRLELGDWILKKEFNRSGDPFLHMYLEIPPEAQRGEVMTKAVLTEHLSLYFKYFDSDYGDLKKLLNMEPLEITLLKHGSIAAYEQRLGEKIPRINPDMMDVTGLLRQQTETEGGRGW